STPPITSTGGRAARCQFSPTPLAFRENPVTFDSQPAPPTRTQRNRTMGFKQTDTHRYGKGSYHQIGLVRGQFGNIDMNKWVKFVADTGFDGWEEASWELDLDKC